MAIQQLNPYLQFDGTAGDAIRHYESALGARTEGLMRWADMPGHKFGPEDGKRVMHSLLHIGAGSVMAADLPPNTPSARESNVHVCLDFDDAAEMQQRFDALAEGGKVTMPVQDMFWGAKFGQLTDRVGVNWMFNCNHKK